MAIEQFLPLIAGAVGGMFGGQDDPEMTQQSRGAWRRVKRDYRDLRQFGKSVPGSDPQEQAALAQGMGLLGQQQGAGLQRLLAAGGGTDTAGMTGDRAGNFASGALGQQSNLFAQMMSQFLQNRRQARTDAAGLMRGAMGAGQYQPQQGAPDFGAMMGGIAQNYAYQQGLKQQQAPAGPAAMGGLGAPTMGPAGMSSLSGQMGAATTAQSPAMAGAPGGGVAGQLDRAQLLKMLRELGLA